MDCIKRSDPAVMACLLGSLGHLGERGEGVLVSQVDRGAVATATTAATATGSTTLATGGAAAAATGTTTATALDGGLVEGLLDLEHLLALLLGAGLGLLRLGRGKVVGLLLLVLGQLGPGRLVAGDLTGSLGLDVELLAGLGSEVLVEGHGLVLLLLGHLLGLGGGSSGSSVGALSLGVGLGLLLGVELLLAILTTPALGDLLLRVDTVGLRVTVEGTASGRATAAAAAATTATALAVAGTAATGVLLLLALGGVSGGSAGSAVLGGATALVAGTGDVALGLGSSSGGGGLGGSLGGGDVLAVV